jgi:hypothetical protein
MIDSDNFVWISASDFAREFRKTNRTAQKWCQTGFALSLGYRIRRDVTGHWEIGIPQHEYSTQFRRNQESVLI